MNANQFIEQQLDIQAGELETACDSHLLSISGSLVAGVDDLVRRAVEGRAGSRQKKLTVLLTTAGGYIEIVQRMVDTLRHHYRVVDFIVPNYAFSAGTVLALSGDAIHMDYYSRLGPIDPQLERTAGRMVPALGYLIQWERLLAKAKDGTITLPEVQLMLEGFDQAELYQYEQARELSISLVEEWLAKYKFKNWKMTETSHTKVTPTMRKTRAKAIASELNNTDRWHVHGHGISMEVLRRDLNLLIDDYEKDAAKAGLVKKYYGLLDDYMVKIGNGGMIHTVGAFQPYL